MKLTVTSTPCGLTEFYDAVAREMGYQNTSELHYNCTKIDIAENIQDGFYEHYMALAMEETPLPESEINVGITMLLALSGPKVNKDLKANEVEVFDGFIC